MIVSTLPLNYPSPPFCLRSKAMFKAVGVGNGELILPHNDHNRSHIVDRSWDAEQLCSFTPRSCTFCPFLYPSLKTFERLPAFHCYDAPSLLPSHTFSVLRRSHSPENATALAATVTWIMRDGAHMLGSLIFARWGGSRFDRDVKFWRLYADVINDVRALLAQCQLAPDVPHYSCM